MAGGALLAAGLYQLTPLKDVCLRHCRSPLHFLLHGRRPGRFGAVRMGMEHGAYCLGCCWGLMLALFALGVMSLFWMAVVGAVILVEKLAPRGQQLAGRLVAVSLLALGVWVTAAPASVPGLVQPNSPGAELARMKMMGMEPQAPGMKMQPAPAMPVKPKRVPSMQVAPPQAMQMQK